MNNRVFTQKEAVAAYKILSKISSQPMSWKTAYWMSKLKKKLGAQLDFQKECEEKLFEKYQPEQTEEGRLKLKTPEEARAFDKEWEEIGSIELADLQFQKVYIPETENLQISMADMEALDGFVQFGPEEPEEEEIPELKVVEDGEE